MKQGLKDSPKTTSAQHNLLIQYLDEFGKQMSTRKNSSGLEEQLSSLSKAYNQAQEKLLQTEKALMSESILIQKQRSIIELYKYILGEEMEDQGILTFIQHLEDQQESKREIYEELGQLKNLLNRKKIKNCKKSISGSKNVRELKSEVEKLQQEQKNLSEESVFICNQNQELKEKVAELTQEVEKYKKQLQLFKKQLGKKQEQLQKFGQQLKMQKQQNSQKGFILNELSTQNKGLAAFKADAQKLLQMLQQKLNLPHKTLNNKQNIDSTKKYLDISKQYAREIEEKLSSLVKYKQQYKKLKDHYKQCELHKREISLLKLFVSEDALTLFKEYQQLNLECLQTQIRNLAVLQKNKLLRLQECERQIWKCRLQLMKEEEENNSIMHNTMYHQTRMNISKEANTLNTNILSAGCQLIKSVTANSNVSEFNASS